MVAIMLSESSDAREARECATWLARAAGLSDPLMVEQAVAEIANNCIEHRDGPGPAIVRLACRPGRLILRAENPCRRRPTWRTAKPEMVEGFRLGGYGLPLIRAIGRNVRCDWRDGRAVVQAEFADRS